MLEDHQGRLLALDGGGRCQAWCMRVKWQKSDEYRGRVVSNILALAQAGVAGAAASMRGWWKRVGEVTSERLAEVVDAGAVRLSRFAVRCSLVACRSSPTAAIVA
jgi:hypothetical protein